MLGSLAEFYSSNLVPRISHLSTLSVLSNGIVFLRALREPVGGLNVKHHFDSNKQFQCLAYIFISLLYNFLPTTVITLYDLNITVHCLLIISNLENMLNIFIICKFSQNCMSLYTIIQFSFESRRESLQPTTNYTDTLVNQSKMNIYMQPVQSVKKRM